MFYLPSEYNEYKYACDYGDNFICLTKNHYAYGSGDPVTISCIYQYFNPSIITIEGTFTTSSDDIYIDVSSQFSDSIFDRADFPTIFICNFIIFFIFAFIVNQLTKIVKKGGVFRFPLALLPIAKRSVRGSTSIEN